MFSNNKISSGLSEDHNDRTIDSEGKQFAWESCSSLNIFLNGP